MLNKTDKVLFAETLKIFNAMSENDFFNEMHQRTIDLGLNVGRAEEISWKENFNALKILFVKSKLPDDVIIAFEYQSPSGGRIDCMLFGQNIDKNKNIIHIELKQWDNNSVEKSFVGNSLTSVLVGTHYHSHPSAQAENYQVHLTNYVKALIDKNLSLNGVVYCYNYFSNKKPCFLLDESYKLLLQRCPLFCKDQERELADLLLKYLSMGNGEIVFNEFISSEIAPTPRLQDAAKDFLEGELAKEKFKLIGEQLNAYNFILDAIKNTKKNEKTVVIVKGGPGTGKSVIAMQLISGLAKTGHFPNVYYSTRSTSLINGFSEILKGVNYLDNRDNAAIDLFKKNVRIKPAVYGENGIDALFVDEAHRIEKSSNDSNDTDPSKQTHLSQIMNLIFCSRVSVFFIDDKQSVKNIEIGTSEAIKNAAENYYTRITKENEAWDNIGRERALNEARKNLEKEEAKEPREENIIIKKEKVVRKFEVHAKEWTKITQPKIEKVRVVEYELKDQFRCNGSNNYLDWIDSILYNDKRVKVKLDQSKYEFGICDTPQELNEKIRSLDDFAKYSDKRAKELDTEFSYRKLAKETANMEFKQTARLVAGWCWSWKQNEREENGDLLHEIKIPEHNFTMPWETLKGGNGATGDFRYKYARNQDLWLIDKEGVNQIGCNHSSQGWETDYIGVIIAKDIKYDNNNDCLVTDNSVKNYDRNVPNSSKERETFDRVTRNIYRVLLTRGKKGCYIFCCDPEVGKYFKRCINQ